MSGRTAADRGRLTVEPLASHHNRAAFSCGVPELDAYLARVAAQNDRRDVSRPFVAVPDTGSSMIMGYYTLSNYAIVCSALPSDLARGLPSRISLPSTLLGRLAVDERYQSQGLGKSLLWHALRAALRATRTSASVGVAVDAMTGDLVAFYMKRGFIELHDKPRHLLMPMNRIRTLFPEESHNAPDIDGIIRDAIAASSLLDEVGAAGVPGQTMRLIDELYRRLEAIRGRDHAPD